MHALYVLNPCSNMESGVAIHLRAPCLLESGCSGAALLVLSQVWRSGINTMTWSGWSGKEADPGTSVSRHISWPTILK